jgi:hypothetical protein
LTNKAPNHRHFGAFVIFTISFDSRIGISNDNFYQNHKILLIISEEMIEDVDYVADGILIVKFKQTNQQYMCAKSGQYDQEITYQLVAGSTGRITHPGPVMSLVHVKHC